MADKKELDTIHEVAIDIISYLDRNFEHHRFTYDVQDMREEAGMVGVTIHDRNDRSCLVTFTGRTWDKVIDKMTNVRNAFTLAYRSGCMVRDA